MATTKSKKAPSKTNRPRGAIRKKANVNSSPTRARRTTTRRVPWEHLGHPSTGVVVTGGASGIGEACALHLAEAGRPVAIWDIDKKGAERVADECAARFRVPTIGLGLDVSKSKGFAAALSSSLKALGQIGGLVHAAGIAGAVQVTMLDDESWDAVLDINLRAAAILTKELTPSLLDAGPGSAIVYISSIEAFFGHDFLPAYSASKAGLLGLTRSAAHTLGPHGIRVNAVCPGAVDTPLLAPLLEIEGQRADLERRTPLQRLAVPDDIAKVVRFLLSDEAGYVSGASLVVDGGLTAISGI